MTKCQKITIFDSFPRICYFCYFYSIPNFAIFVKNTKNAIFSTFSQKPQNSPFSLKPHFWPKCQFSQNSGFWGYPGKPHFWPFWGYPKIPHFWPFPGKPQNCPFYPLPPETPILAIAPCDLPWTHCWRMGIYQTLWEFIYIFCFIIFWSSILDNFISHWISVNFILCQVIKSGIKWKKVENKVSGCQKFSQITQFPLPFISIILPFVYQ